MVNSILFVASLLASMAAATPTIMARDPSDTSGNSNMNMECSELILPNPGTTSGTGEGGEGFFDHSLYFQPPNNQPKVYPSKCTVNKDNANCADCTISGSGLDETSVLACWNPPAGAQGCSMKFDYKGYTYNTQTGEAKCGHRKLGSFGDAKFLGICYFDE